MTRANALLRAALRQQKGHKYHAQPTRVDGVRFDSRAEARRFGELLMLERAGSIRGLRRQPEFPLYASIGSPILVPDRDPLALGVYRADFAYEALTETGGRWDPVVEDVKGVDTPLSKWKRAHVRAQYGIEVVLIRGRR